MSKSLKQPKKAPQPSKRSCWNCKALPLPKPKKEPMPPQCKLCGVQIDNGTVKEHKQSETHKLRQELADKLPELNKDNLEFILMNPLAVGEQEKKQQ